MQLQFHVTILSGRVCMGLTAIALLYGHEFFLHTLHLLREFHDHCHHHLYSCILICCRCRCCTVAYILLALGTIFIGFVSSWVILFALGLSCLFRVVGRFLAFCLFQGFSGYPDQFAGCFPPQLVHFTLSPGCFWEQSRLLWSPAHFTHFGLL